MNELNFEHRQSDLLLFVWREKRSLRKSLENLEMKLNKRNGILALDRMLRGDATRTDL